MVRFATTESFLFVQHHSTLSYALFLAYDDRIGDDFGRVLVGIQVPEGDEANDKLHRFLNTLHYNYVEETDNPIYHKFLRSDH